MNWKPWICTAGVTDLNHEIGFNSFVLLDEEGTFDCRALSERSLPDAYNKNN
jgi:hypothetical protein